jgi:hypothetical protein
MNPHIFPQHPRLKHIPNSIPGLYKIPNKFIELCDLILKSLDKRRKEKNDFISELQKLLNISCSFLFYQCNFDILISLLRSLLCDISHWIFGLFKIVPYEEGIWTWREEQFNCRPPSLWSWEIFGTNIHNLLTFDFP